MPVDERQPNVWIRILNDRFPLPKQGWKLHVSATVKSATEVLGRVYPILLSNGACFKVAASYDILVRLNAGLLGISQVGKFITIYPQNEKEAVSLASALDRATCGLRGPAIPSDRRLNARSLVSYRYGHIAGPVVRTTTGQFLSMLNTPDGGQVHDRRLPTYDPPSWAEDPFAAGGICQPFQNISVVADRYLVVSTTHRSPRGAIHMAVDFVAARRCLLKQGVRDGALSADGCDAIDRLRHEIAILEQLSSEPHFPRVWDIAEHDGDLFLVTEDFEGVTLWSHVTELALRGQFVSTDKVLAWALELTILLGALHTRGFVYRDLKPTNIIITKDGVLRLVDFEHVGPIGVNPIILGGTPGYMSPQQSANKPSDVRDDVYSLGALLYFLATNAEPSLAPQKRPLLDRSVASLNPKVPIRLSDIIAKCLDSKPERRFSTLADVENALRSLSEQHRTLEYFPHERHADDEDRNTFCTLATEIGRLLCRVARRRSGGELVGWDSVQPESFGSRLLDLGEGAAGTVLALIELSATFNLTDCRSTAEEGAYLLAGTAHSQWRLPGLYVGEAGVGTALLRAGQLFRSSELVEAAAKRGRWVASTQHDSPDLYNGSAGRLRFHLFLWEETGESEHLRHAVKTGEILLHKSIATDQEVYWESPSGIEGSPYLAYLGYAHGAAGIADALLDLFEKTGDEQFLRAAQGAARWLIRHAIPVLNDGNGLGWPLTEGGQPRPPFWCHGATGIGRFFVHAAKLGVFRDALSIAERAAESAAWGARWGGPVQCHGLAGNIEFLLDIARLTGSENHLFQARSLAHLMMSWCADLDEVYGLQADDRQALGSDYMTGYGGVAMCLLRLCNPSQTPHQLSLEGFRYRP